MPLVLALLSGCASINLVPTQAPILRLEEIHDLGATRVEFDPAGKRMATGGYRGEVYIWSVPEGKRLASLEKHDGMLLGMVWLNEAQLVTGAEDGLIIIWDVNKQQVLLQKKTKPVTAMTIIPRAGVLLTGHTDGKVRSWSLPELKLLKTYSSKGRINSIAVNPEQTLVAAATDTSKVFILDTNLKYIKDLPTRDKNAQELHFSPDGKQLAAGTWFELYFWDLSDGKLTVKETEHIGAIISLDYTPDGSKLVTLGRHTDANIRLRDIKKQKMERRLRAHNLCGYSIRISPDGKYVASASEDSSVRLYDISTPYNPTWGE